ncbi:hypothetical protein BJ508DRAFT_358208 [Ascobolus immersus RN42]|uniref:Uncharacterized protein n=1 Tax=Ascobolus immersus RN42 TaxID=1160509 RepID=A0A3N4IPG3_ASCIM|nr:hypothetical protein BJ508DRAFT_358208 [Ascobolus immersus RN42]
MPHSTNKNTRKRSYSDFSTEPESFDVSKRYDFRFTKRDGSPPLTGPEILKRSRALVLAFHKSRYGDGAKWSTKKCMKAEQETDEHRDKKIRK